MEVGRGRDGSWWDIVILCSKLYSIGVKYMDHELNVVCEAPSSSPQCCSQISDLIYMQHVVHTPLTSNTGLRPVLHTVAHCDQSGTALWHSACSGLSKTAPHMVPHSRTHAACGTHPGWSKAGAMHSWPALQGYHVPEWPEQALRAWYLASRMERCRVRDVHGPVWFMDQPCASHLAPISRKFNTLTLQEGWIWIEWWVHSIVPKSLHKIWCVKKFKWREAPATSKECNCLKQFIKTSSWSKKTQQAYIKF